VQPLDPATGKGTRVKFEMREGVKHRVAVGSGTDLGRSGRAAKA
jgi:large subunit ribosomal protein L24